MGGCLIMFDKLYKRIEKENQEELQEENFDDLMDDDEDQFIEDTTDEKAFEQAIDLEDLEDDN
jgi:hypothetical protein